MNCGIAITVTAVSMNKVEQVSASYKKQQTTLNYLEVEYIPT